MAVSRIDKIKLIAHEENKTKILELLYEGGFLEIIKEKQQEDTAFPGLIPAGDSNQLEYDLARVKHSLEILRPFELDKKNFLEKINFEKPSFRKKELESLLASFNYRLVSDLISVFGQDINNLTSLNAKLNDEINYLKPWRGLELPTSQANTEKTKIVYGVMGLKAYQAMIAGLGAMPEYLFLDIAGQDEENVYLLAIILKTEYPKVIGFLEENFFKAVELPVFDIKISQKIARLEQEIKTASARIDNLKDRLRGECGYCFSNLQAAADYLQWQLDQKTVQDNFCFTEKTFCVSGWLPRSRRAELEKQLAGVSRNISLITAPAAADEEPPVLMANTKLIQPFEFVTNIYGHPRHNEIDPTPFLAGFFIIFFGLCLTDAGYGITLALASLLALRFLKVGREFAKLLKVLFIGSLITIAAGGLTGGWFGIVLEDLPAGLSWLSGPLLKIRAIDPVSNPIAILGLSLLLGYIHLVFGNIINLWWRIKHQEIKAGLIESGVWLFFLLAAGLWLALARFSPAASPIGKYLLFSAAILIVLTRGQSKNFLVKILGGLGDLYFGITGYISDILSYSRLLALGLATGIIGMVINIIGLMAGELVPYVGWLLMVLIIVGGHLFNLVISLIGAFIHSGRLQYVEFFKTFFEGGGRKFSPFIRQSQYIYLIKE